MTPTLDRLDEHTSEWVTAGLISPAQARAIVEYDAAHHDVTIAAPPARLGPVAEAGALVGTVLALIGGGIGLGPQWGDVPLALRLAIACAIAAVGFVAGRWLIRLGEAGTQRLGGFLWVLAAGGVALASGTIADEVRPDSPWTAVAIGAPVAAIGAGLWRNRERPLQVLTLAVGLAIAGGGVASLAGLDAWHAATPVLVLGVAAWLVTTRFATHPLAVVRSLSAITMIGGALMLCDLSNAFGAAVALATAATVIVLALHHEHTAVLVVGVLGALAAVQVLVTTTFHGPIGGAIVALTGLVMVAVIVAHTRRREVVRRRVS
jgi:hypothetical protein